jgi:uncharacterized membrane protein YraQ (UPF0718 family)
LIGMLLPVCSLGAIPVVRQLHKAGVPGGAILAFALSAPLFNPISLLYGLSLSNPTVILTFALLSLLIVTIVGVLIERCFPFPPRTAEIVPPVSYGIRRMLAIGVHAAREAYSGQGVYLAVGLLGSALLSLFLPYGFLQDKAERVDAWAPLFMAAVSLPMYETPMTMIIKLGDMFQHGNSVGAAFALMILGAGVNAGVVVWLWLHYGKSRTFGCVGTLFLIVVALSYLVDAPLTPKGVTAAGHTHAFDVYCSPFHPNDTVNWAVVSDRFQKGLPLFELISLMGWAALLLCGWFLTRATRLDRLERWLEVPVDRSGSLDVELSPKVLGSLGLVGLIAASVLGCFLYYPPIEEIFEELKQSQIPLAAAGVTGDWDGVNYWLPVVDDWSRRIQVSAYLRRIPQSQFHEMKARIFRDKLDLLRHAAEDRDPEEARAASFAVQRAFGRFRSAYLPETAPTPKQVGSSETDEATALPADADVPPEPPPQESPAQPATGGLP